MTANPIVRSATMPIQYIWLGDFNRHHPHHPLWDKPQNSHLFTKQNLDLTQPLLNMLNRFNMKMALPTFIPTLQAHSTGNHTRVDNVFCSEGLMEAITKCYTDDAKQPVKTDHYPITTVLDIHMTKTECPPRFNFRKMNWPEFLPMLESNLDKLPQPAHQQC